MKHSNEGPFVSLWPPAQDQRIRKLFRSSYLRDASDGSASGSPTRISFEKSRESLAARARASIRLLAFNSAKGSPPVTKPPSRYNNSSPLPLSRIRQSHGILSLLGCWLRMVVVQLVVMALYQRGCARSALSERTYSRKRSRARFWGTVVW